MGTRNCWSPPLKRKPQTLNLKQAKTWLGPHTVRTPEGRLVPELTWVDLQYTKIIRVLVGELMEDTLGDSHMMLEAQLDENSLKLQLSSCQLHV